MQTPNQDESPPDELLGALPQFDPEPEPETPDPAPPRRPEEPTPSATSPSPGYRAAGSETTTASTSSSTGSSEPPSISLEDVVDALGDTAGELFRSTAQWLNRRESRRRRRPTTRWLATQDEVEAMGHLAEQYLGEKIPDQVAESEHTAALAVGGLVLAGYALRNLLGGDDQAQAPGPPAPAPEPRPAPPPPAPRVAPVVTVSVDPASTGIAPPEAPPPSVITPDL